MLRLLTLLITVLLWMSGSLYLSLSYFECFLRNSWHQRVLTGDQLTLLIAFVFSVHALEFLLGAVAVRSLIVLRQKQRSTGTLLLVIFTAVLTLYFALITTSWMMFGFRNVFLEPGDLSLLYYLSDVQTSYHMLSGADFSLAIMMFIAALSCTLLLLAFALKCSAAAFREVLTLTSMLLLLCIVLFFRIHQLSEGTTGHASRRLLTTSFSPQVALLTHLLLPESSTAPKASALALNTLPKSYSLEDYFKTIPEDFQPKQNIVLIVVEALRWDVMDHRANSNPMPMLSRLAQDGSLFLRTFAQANDTDYSMRAILTGLHPLKSKQRDLNIDAAYPFFRIYDLLKGAGYRTGFFGSEWRLSKKITRSSRLDVHYDPVLSTRTEAEKAFTHSRGLGERLPPKTLDSMVVGRFQDWVKESENPFFAVIYLMSSHFPYEASKYIRLNTPQSTPAFFAHANPETTKLLKEKYLISLGVVDSFLAQITHFLETQGVAEQTSLLITGDHGEEFGEHGGYTHAAHLSAVSIRVPLVLHGIPPQLPLPTPQTVVNHIDIAPSILSIAGLPQTAAFQGNTLLSAGQSSQQLQAKSFSSVQMITFQDAILDWPYRLILDHRTKSTQLYNLELDPYEQNELSHSMQETKDRLLSALFAFRNRQLEYYRLPQGIRQRYFAPRIDE